MIEALKESGSQKGREHFWVQKRYYYGETFCCLLVFFGANSTLEILLCLEKGIK